MQSKRIAILGGGLAGRLCALSLCQAGFGVDLFDPGALNLAESASNDRRTTAFSRQSRVVLTLLELWSDLQAQACAVSAMHIGAGGSPSQGLSQSMRLEAKDAGVEALAWIVENADFGKTLNAALRPFVSSGWLSLREGQSVYDLIVDAAGNVSIFTSGDLQETYELVIGCDGRNSTVRRHAFNDVGSRVAYDQHALVAVIEHSQEHKGVATQVFLPDGPVALLPMQRSIDKLHPRSSLIWSAKPYWVQAMLDQSSEALAHSLNTRLGEILGEVKSVSSVAGYPLEARLASTFSAQGLALVGDAAHAVHPLAGQGFNLTVGDIASLTECVINAENLGQPLGHALALEPFSNHRRLAAQKIFALTDGLSRLFSRKNPLGALVRKVGFPALDPFEGIKASLIQIALEDSSS